MNKWADGRIGDMCEVVSLRAGDDDLPVLSVSKDLGIVLQSEKFKKRIASENTSNYKRVLHGDFVFDPMLLWAGNIGRQRRVPEGIVSPAYTVFRIRTPSLDPDFLETLLTWPSMRHRYGVISRGTNVRRQKVLFADFANLRVPTPSIGEQRKIAAILSAVDDAIEATQAVINQLQVVKKAMMAELLTRGLPGRHTRFKQTEIGEVPEGWDVLTLGSVLDFQGGTQPPRSTFLETPQDGYVRLLQIRDFENDDNAVYVREESVSGRCKTTDIMVARYGASLGRVLTGKAGAYNVALVKMLPAPARWDQRFLFHWLAGDVFQGRLRETGARSAQAGFNKADLHPTPVALTPLLAQCEVAKAVDSVMDTLAHNESVHSHLTTVKSALMSVLLSGEVRAKPDEVTP